MADQFNFSDVFISYSRRNSDFVHQLHDELAARDHSIWVDFEDIPLTADWWAEIVAGIEAANDFIFVITPDSVRSEICRREIDHAVSRNKRLVPVLHIEVTEEADKEKIHPAIGAANWIFFRETDDHDEALDKLLAILTTDLDHVRQHTRLTVRAAEWENRDKQPAFLLRGTELLEAENWLARATGKAPQPTSQQLTYIYDSRKTQASRTRRLLIGVSSALVIVVILSVIALATFSQLLDTQQNLLQANRAVTAANEEAQSILATAERLGDEASTSVAIAATAEFNADSAQAEADVAATDADIAAMNAAAAEDALAGAEATAQAVEALANVNATEAAINAASAADALQQAGTARANASNLAAQAITATIALGDAQSQSTSAFVQAAAAEAIASTAEGLAVAAEQSAIEAARQAATADAARGTAEAQGTQIIIENRTVEANAATADALAQNAAAEAATADVARATAEHQGTQAVIENRTVEAQAAQAQQAADNAAALASTAANDAATADAARGTAEAQGTQAVNSIFTVEADAQIVRNEAATAQARGLTAEADAVRAATTAAEAENAVATANDAQRLAEQGSTAVALNNMTSVAQGLTAIAEVRAAEIDAIIAQSAADEALRDAEDSLNALGTAEAKGTDIALGQATNVAVLSAQGTLVVLEQRRADFANATAAQRATDVEQEAATSIAAVATATSALGQAAIAGTEVVFQAATSEANAATAEFNAVLAASNARDARAQSLAVSASELLEAGEIDLAVALAIEAGRLDADLVQARRVLSQAAPLGVRLSFETYADTLSYYNNPEDFFENPHPAVATFNPEGDQVLIANVDNSLSVWNIASRQEIYRLVGHESQVLDAVYTDDGRFIVSLSHDAALFEDSPTNSSIIVWDANSGREVRRVEGHEGLVFDIAARPETTHVASAGEDRTLRITDVATGDVVFNEVGLHTSPIESVRFNGNGRFAFSFTENNMNRWSIATGSVSERTDPIYRGFDDTGAFAYTGGQGPSGQQAGFLQLWESASIEPIRRFSTVNLNFDQEYVQEIAFNPDGDRVLVYVESWPRGQDRTRVFDGTRFLAEWGIGGNEVLATYTVPGRVSALTYSRDGRFFLVASTANRANILTLHDSATGRELRRFTGHEDIIDQIAFNRSATRALSVSRDGNIRVWEISLNDTSELSRYNIVRSGSLVPGAQTPNLAFSPNGENLLYSGNINLYRTSRVTRSQMGDPFYAGDAIRYADFNTTANLALSALGPSSTFGTASLVDLNTGEILQRFGGETAFYSALALSADGQVAVLGGVDATDRLSLDVYTFPTRTTVEQTDRMELDAIDLTSDMTNVRRMAFSPDGSLLAVSGPVAAGDTRGMAGDVVVLFDFETKAPIYRLDTGGQSAISDLTFSPDGLNLLGALGSPDNVLVVWNVETGTRTLDLSGHRDAVTSAAYNVDGSLAISSSNDGDVIVWDAARGRPIRTFEGHNRAVLEVTFGPDGSIAASADRNQIIIWRVDTFAELVQWTYENRYVPQFTCAQRSQFNVLPLCDENGEVIAAVETLEPDIAIATPTLTPIPSPTATPDRRGVVVDEQGLDVRDGPNENANIIASADAGEIVNVLRTEGDWALIRLPQGTEGWVLRTGIGVVE